MNAPVETTLRTPRQLAAAGLVTDPDALTPVAARYAIAVTPEVAAEIGRSGPLGPIGRQYLPSMAELAVAPHETADPTGDDAHAPITGIVHRYPDRVLLLPTKVCAVYCRFCFRRDRVGPAAGALTDAELNLALDYIRSRPEIWEVILSGGDPLVLSARRLQRIVAALDEIAHVAVIRIHSRVPVAAPDMVDDALLAVIRAATKPVYIAVHCNHASELTPRAQTALRRLRDAGAILLGQTVLLREVNDSIVDLEALFRAMVASGVKPYYLHQLDPAPGTAHFAVPIERGRALIKGLRGRVSGLALPTLVLDVPGGSGKVPLGPDHVQSIDGGVAAIESLDGRVHRIV